MGVLNVTPDSFSDGGTLYRSDRLDTDLLLARAEQMVADGAAIVDIGGESTRPGATPVTLDEERDRTEKRQVLPFHGVDHRHHPPREKDAVDIVRRILAVLEFRCLSQVELGIRLHRWKVTQNEFDRASAGDHVLR